MYYKLKISETASNTLTTDKTLFNVITETFESVDKVKEFLIDRYGNLPSGKIKVYRDKKDGGQIEIGFTHSYWNKDISHNSASWHQTDWIEVSEVTEVPVLITK